MFAEYSQKVTIALVVAVVILYSWLAYTTYLAASSFASLESQPAFGAISGAPALRFQPRTDTGSTSELAIGGGGSCGCPSSSFHGGPEPPVFYEIGELDASRKASVSRKMGKGNGLSGFASLDERLLALQ